MPKRKTQVYGRMKGPGKLAYLHQKGGKGYSNASRFKRVKKRKR